MENLKLEKLMNQEEMNKIGINKLTQNECEALTKWGLRMFSLGQYHVADIDEIKYSGRLIILNDGSRWEVDEIDSGTSEYWDSFQKVVVIDDEMYLLENCEKVSVQEDNS
ncbi:MAG: hypothetical protein U0354_19185 [Candidatus Sericytochromatia bacterium]